MNSMTYEAFIREINNIMLFRAAFLRTLDCDKTDKDSFFRTIASYIKQYLNDCYNHPENLYIGIGMNAASFADKFFMMVNRTEPEFELFSKILTETIGQTLPSGELIGYKKAVSIPDEDDDIDLTYDRVLIKLRIPKSAIRSRAFSYKCRCSEALVERIYSMEDPNITYDVAYSVYNVGFVYETGKTVKVDNFDTCPWVECSTGIHFFLDEYDARNYYI